MTASALVSAADAGLLVRQNNTLAGPGGAALFSACSTYRYALTRTWDPTNFVTFVMLNPSTADSDVDDATIHRCTGYARSWQFGGLLVLNLFALRSTDPKSLYAHPDPVGPANDAVVELFLHATDGPVVAAWGAHGALRNRDQRIVELLARLGIPLRCLGVTRAGFPRHPLRLRKDLQPVPFTPEGR